MKVLIGYDGSKYGDFIIEDLQKAGLPEDTEAVVLTVGEAWELPLVAEGVSARGGRFIHPTATMIKDHLAEICEEGRKTANVVAERLKTAFPGWRVAVDAACGKPAAELIKKADEWLPDLLVVGSHGRSTVGRFLLGSVSQKVLHEARCAVRIAREKAARDDPKTRILLAVDGSPNAEAVVKTVAGRRWTPETEVRLIAVNDPFSHPQVGYMGWNLEEDKPQDDEKSREWIAKVINAPAETLKAAGLNVSHVIHWGDAANMILKEAKQWKPDSIFIGARGLGRFKRFLLGSVSSTVAAKASCSVEVIRISNDGETANV
jgi:nucleotide-binding universal stress UspA family protein